MLAGKSLSASRPSVAFDRSAKVLGKEDIKPHNAHLGDGRGCVVYREVEVLKERLCQVGEAVAIVSYDEPLGI